MHGDNPVELSGIKLLPQCGAQLICAALGRAQPDNAKRSTAARSTADRDPRNSANHVLEASDVGLRPFGLVGECGAVGGTVQDLECRSRIEAEIFRAALMRDIASGFQKTVDRDALLEMFAVGPAIEFDLVGG